ncbi:uncharacterized protein TM35_000311690, partial [Trypanosoma theileri]
MSMLPCRVLCLLAIVFCCVGVAHANAQTSSKIVTLAEETSKLKEECEEAGTAAKNAAREASSFVSVIEQHLKTVPANPKEAEAKKQKGIELIQKARAAADNAKQLAEKTYAKSNQSLVEAETARRSEESNNSLLEEIATAIKAAEAAKNASSNAHAAATEASTTAQRLQDAVDKLEVPVSAAKEKEKEEQMKQENEKQVESQAQEQTNETSLVEQQSHTEGNQAEQTEEQKQRSRSTVTINIHGDNLDSLLNGAANKSGMALNDGSSSPALLRVPLLLLLLSVLGCMA